jgi:hypothetical protein
MKPAGIPKNASGIGGFVNGARVDHAALVMGAAVAPLALIAGGIVLIIAWRGSGCSWPTAKQPLPAYPAFRDHSATAAQQQICQHCGSDPNDDRSQQCTEHTRL